MRRGFTLLEMLVAVAVLGLLLVLLDQGFAFGLRATTMQSRETDRQGDLDAIDHALRQLIAHADAGVMPDRATLKGQADSVSMITELPDPATGKPERVTATIYASGGDLRLSWAPERHVQNLGPPPSARETTLMAGVSGAQFGYFGPGGWASAWNADRLPALVRLQLRFRDAARHWPPIIVAPRLDPVGQ